jgi:multiple sugar transport system permease protein
LFIAPAVIYVAVFFGYPVLKNIVMSFQDYTTRTFFTGEAPWVGFANYAATFGSSLFTTTIVNTALFTVGSIVAQFVIGLGLALFFRRHFPLSGFLRGLLLLPWLLPLIASSAVWKWILDQDSGALNQFLALFGVPAVPWLVSPNLALIAVIGVNIWLGIPFNTTILYSGLQGVPQELYEAASLDGAVGARAFRYITWPSIRSVVSVVIVLGVVYTLKVVDIILGLTGGGPANSTQTLATNAYHQSFVNFEFGQGAAVSNVLIVVSFAFAIVYISLSRKAVDE